MPNSFLHAIARDSVLLEDRNSPVSKCMKGTVLQNQAFLEQLLVFVGRYPSNAAFHFESEKHGPLCVHSSALLRAQQDQPPRGRFDFRIRFDRDFLYSPNVRTNMRLTSDKGESTSRRFGA